MFDYQQRVVVEQQELLTKIEKLSAFIDGKLFRGLSTEEQDLLNEQLASMRKYHYTLIHRIELFKSQHITRT